MKKIEKMGKVRGYCEVWLQGTYVKVAILEQFFYADLAKYVKCGKEMNTVIHQVIMHYYGHDWCIYGLTAIKQVMVGDDMDELIWRYLKDTKEHGYM